MDMELELTSNNLIVIITNHKDIQLDNGVSMCIKNSVLTMYKGEEYILSISNRTIITSSIYNLVDENYKLALHVLNFINMIHVNYTSDKPDTHITKPAVVRPTVNYIVKD